MKTANLISQQDTELQSNETSALSYKDVWRRFILQRMRRVVYTNSFVTLVVHNRFNKAVIFK